MNPTIPVTAAETTETHATLDDLVLAGLTAAELDVVAAYQWATGMSVVTLVAKMRVS